MRPPLPSSLSLVLSDRVANRRPNDTFAGTPLLRSRPILPGLVPLDENTNGRRDASFSATACPRRAAHRFGVVLNTTLLRSAPEIAIGFREQAIERLRHTYRSAVNVRAGALQPIGMSRM